MTRIIRGEESVTGDELKARWEGKGKLFEALVFFGKRCYLNGSQNPFLPPQNWVFDLLSF